MSVLEAPARERVAVRKRPDEACRARPPTAPAAPASNVRNGRRLARRRRRVRGCVWAIALIACAAAWAVTLRPQALGGRATYVMVSGVSMLPTFESGDLVITRAQPRYRTGDVVAYRVPKGEIGADTVVIHRIIGGSGNDGFVLQGDSNDERDEWRPTTADIVGKAWLHIPRAARVLAFLHAPVPAAALATALAVTAVMVPAQRSRKRRGVGSSSAAP